MSTNPEPATAPERRKLASDTSQRYESPSFEVIELGCEITAYAPAGDEPLF
jgi:hypothetical protein